MLYSFSKSKVNSTGHVTPLAIQAVPVVPSVKLVVGYDGLVSTLLITVFPKAILTFSTALEAPPKNFSIFVTENSSIAILANIAKSSPEPSVG